ncbi:hypothetical protein [Saccharomonospora xinjiangensis]|uniref:Integral membrane protein n=1 Tax=Saccharomonospora xinjiangensis XJ-54 TaxID=882086 RepID=I0V564_9PSEU|nr:hypothetical protein [Saccharomonospora xinjiangensis]EID55267.1 hypothetical protein SacxiDRAFT_3057 [Saccharomonospora xinjiangensis XJ-54]
MPLPGPDTHVVELRVPGLIGTTGDNLLDSMGTVDVAGDGVGRIIRPSDRLRRPAPGPVLQAPGRSVSRTLEGYLWSRMTSGGAAKAAWALLFPFALVNVAQWMLPPESGSRASLALSAVCRALLRVAALLLTMLLVGQLAVISLDLLAVQCLSPGAGCLDGAPAWMREIPAVRTVLGLTPLLGLIGVLFAVTSTSWKVNAPRLRERKSHLPGGTLLDDEQETTTLRCLHTVAALGVVVLVLLGGPLTAPDRIVDAVVWAVALALLGFSSGAAALHAHRLLGPVSRAALIALALLLVTLASFAATPLTARVSAGANATVELVAAALFAVCVLFALLLVPTAVVARKAWSALPRRLRPWAGGWAAAPALALAALLGGGFGAGTAIAARHLLDPSLALPQGYTLITLLWGAGLVFAALVAVPVFTVSVPLRRARRGVPEVLHLMETREEDIDDAADAWARAAWERKHLHRIVLAVVLAMIVGAAVLMAVRLGAFDLPSVLAPLSAVGVVALGGLAGALLRAVLTTATGTMRVRHLAAFADLVCFWPRVAHPVVPPSYALKVVPELAERTKEHLRTPDSRVVLAGYHVGGLLAVITAGRLSDELDAAELERLGLLTAGTPLQWGYQRAFPGVFGHDGLVTLFGALDGRWRGLCRGTDTFGGGATTWRHQVAGGELLGIGYLPEGRVGPLEPADRGPHGVLVLGGDHWLPDPAQGPVKGRRWAPGVRRHADYIAEPEWDRAVAYAAGLDGISPVIPEPTRPTGPAPSDILGTPRTGRVVGRPG